MRADVAAARPLLGRDGELREQRSGAPAEGGDAGAP